MEKNIITNLILWSLIGIFLFNLFVIIVFRTGFVWKSRNKKGLLKKKQSFWGYLSMLILPTAIVIIQLLFNYFSFNSTFSFTKIFLLNYLLYAILFVYDTFVIDYITLSLWKPKFLKIPKNLNSKSMNKHILISIPFGAIIGLIITLISVLIFYYLIL
jgi:hypothetical protein